MIFGHKNKTSDIPAPIGLVDLHCHILAGVDDGAQSDEQMYDLMRLEYGCGVRHLCFTPHFNPALFPPKPDKIAESYRKAQIFARDNFPDLNLYLGNEIFARPDTMERLRDASCKPLGDSKTVLVEFRPTESCADIRLHAVKLLSNGYSPLLAHIERYDHFEDLDVILELRSLGAKFQVNTEAFFGRRKKFIAKLAEQGLIDVVADDRHGRELGAPDLAETYTFVAQKFGIHAAEALFKGRPLSILNISEKTSL